MVLVTPSSFYSCSKKEEKEFLYRQIFLMHGDYEQLSSKFDSKFKHLFQFIIDESNRSAYFFDRF